jgi:hypothetical protein
MEFPSDYCAACRQIDDCADNEEADEGGEQVMTFHQLDQALQEEQRRPWRELLELPKLNTIERRCVDVGIFDSQYAGKLDRSEERPFGNER